MCCCIITCCLSGGFETAIQKANCWLFKVKQHAKLLSLLGIEQLIVGLIKCWSQGNCSNDVNPLVLCRTKIFIPTMSKGENLKTVKCPGIRQYCMIKVFLVLHFTCFRKVCIKWCICKKKWYTKLKVHTVELNKVL